MQRRCVLLRIVLVRHPYQLVCSELLSTDTKEDTECYRDEKEDNDNRDCYHDGVIFVVSGVCTHIVLGYLTFGALLTLFNCARLDSVTISAITYTSSIHDAIIFVDTPFFCSTRQILQDYTARAQCAIMFACCTLNYCCVWTFTFST